MQADPDVTVVVPVFNGAPTLRTLFTGIQDVMASMSLRAEVIFVDDGSSDESWRVIGELKAEHGDLLRGFRLARNFGQQAATYCGLLEACGKWVVTIDDDLQPHPREIRTLWDHAVSAHTDVVYGVYATPPRALIRRLATRLFRLLLRRVAPRFPDGSSFRLIRGEVVRSIPRHLGPGILVDPVLAWHTADI